MIWDYNYVYGNKQEENKDNSLLTFHFEKMPLVTGILVQHDSRAGVMITVEPSKYHHVVFKPHSHVEVVKVGLKSHKKTMIKKL